MQDDLLVRRHIRLVVGAAAVVLGVLGWLFIAVPAGASVVIAAPATTPNTSSTGNGWLALGAILFGAGVCLALVIVVSKDRRESREAVLKALEVGASSVTQSDTPLTAGLAGGAPPGADLVVTSDHDSVQVGSTATLSVTDGTRALACTWEFEPAGIVTPSGTGPNADMVVTGVKAGTVTATATWTNPTEGATPPLRTGSKQLAVVAAKSAGVNFSILGAGLGSSLLALLAISGAIALSFRGVFTAEVGTLLGTALGAGAAGAVSATHSPNNSNKSSSLPSAGSS